MVTGTLNSASVQFAKKATVCKYVVPEGYPDDAVKNSPIDIEGVENKACLYLASVDYREGTLYALGSRTAAYVGIDESISAAEKIAESEVSAIDGRLYHREDIGTPLLIQQRVDSLRNLRAL
jgi:phosphoribosylamine--glycine ligase